jgi:hypothetical protein
MINIDWNNPIILSIASILVTFSVLVILLLGLKPSFIMKPNDDGKDEIDRGKVGLYSFLFAFLVGIITFFTFADKEERNSIHPANIPSDAFKPNKINLSY